ncbi:protein phosphatase 2C-like domain-containing protein 1 [Diadema setosum]|uniref:protein phosphatase 2C-like domain-containing protein 1 n=1 Tax=Diadema setosum TaxID=31175 RepID=UPI003B3B3FFC
MSSDISSVSGGGGGAGGPAPSVLQIKTRNIIRPPTPETVITERPMDPDISIYCDSCREFISVRATQEHRAFHSALTTLGYKGSQQPDNVKSLLKRRQALMRELNARSDCNNPVPFDRLQKINEAYEMVKAHLEDTYEELIHTKENLVYECNGIALNCSAPCVRAVGFCSDDNKRWKSKMEDTRVFQDYYGNDVNRCFFAIYDGYNGRFAADIAANDLHHLLLNELQKVDQDVSCTCTVNLADKNDLSDYQLERKSVVVRRDSLRHILHEESVNIIQQIMHTCESNLMKLNETSPEEEEGETPARRKKYRDPESEKMGLAFHRAYTSLDRYLSYGINETSLVRWSGCSALTLVIQNSMAPEDKEEETKEKKEEEEEDVRTIEEKEETVTRKSGKEEEEEETHSGNDNEETKDKELPPLQELGVLHLANAGNTHAVLCRAGKAYRLSRDHTPGNAQERSRVKKAGSSVQAGGTCGRVNGILDTTRGLGNYGDPHLKKAVIPDPYTTSVKIDQHAQFIILATAGLWEVLTDDEVVSLVKQTLVVQHTKSGIATVPDGYGYEMSEATTFGEDFGGSAVGGLEASLGQTAFDNTEASHIDIDGAEEADGAGSKYQYRNPDAFPEDNEEDADSKSQITWNQPLVNGDQPESDQQKSVVDEENGPKDGIRVKAGTEGSQAGSRTDGGSLRNFKEEFNDDVASVKTDFESMISALCEDGNEADIDTLTEMHTLYTKSRLSEGLGAVDKKEEYRMMAQTVSERLVQSALLAGSQDNVTVMAVLLDGCQL